MNDDIRETLKWFHRNETKRGDQFALTRNTLTLPIRAATVPSESVTKIPPTTCSGWQKNSLSMPLLPGLLSRTVSAGLNGDCNNCQSPASPAVRFNSTSRPSIVTPSAAVPRPWQQQSTCDASVFTSSPVSRHAAPCAPPQGAQKRLRKPHEIMQISMNQALKSNMSAGKPCTGAQGGTQAVHPAAEGRGLEPRRTHVAVSAVPVSSMSGVSAEGNVQPPSQAGSAAVYTPRSMRGVVLVLADAYRPPYRSHTSLPTNVSDVTVPRSRLTLSGAARMSRLTRLRQMVASMRREIEEEVKLELE